MPRKTPFATAKIQQRRAALRQILSQPSCGMLSQRRVVAGVKKRAARLHHFGTVARIPRALMLHREKIYIPFLCDIELMVAGAPEASGLRL